jgi:hypothetical protein
MRQIRESGLEAFLRGLGEFGRALPLLTLGTCALSERRIVANKYQKLLAHHEAGHAVAMYELGYEVPFATVVGSEQDAGHVRTPFVAGNPVLDVVIVRAAGAAAEDIFHEKAGTGLRFIHSGLYPLDLEACRELLDQPPVYFESSKEPLELWWWIEALDLAKDLLLGKWVAVESIADQLQSHKTLDAEQIAALL